MMFFNLVAGERRGFGQRQPQKLQKHMIKPHMLRTVHHLVGVPGQRFTRRCGAVSVVAECPVGGAPTLQHLDQLALVVTGHRGSFENGFGKWVSMG
ncbi:hypothetical protein D9M69_611220 [compost metagenome]